MAISIGDALLKLGVDKTGLESGMKDAERSVQVSMKSIQQGLMAAGAAFTAVGVAGMKMVGDAKRMNAELGKTALNLDITTKEMRDLALATTNVTFPLKEVISSFDLLARAGVEDTEVMQRVATAFDTLGDATGTSASQVTNNMIPAMKTFGLTADEMASKIDMFTYLNRETTLSLEDFNTMVGYTTPELVEMGLTVDDLAAAIIHMESQGYAPGRVMTREFMKATTLAQKEQISLTEALGMTSEELETIKSKLEGATGMTQKYADVANEQYTIVDKVKQKISEFSLAVGSTLEPLEGMFGAMTALGPAMIGVGMILPKLIGLFKSLPMIFRAVQLAAISMWGAITLGVSLAIAAGIALWQNWDKVSAWLQKAWANIKIFFLEGVENILSSLERFTSFIPWLGDKVSEARESISNMVEAERVKKDLLEVEQALAETTEIIKEHTEATEVDTKALIENTEALVEQKDELLDKIEKTRKAFEYERSEAGKLRITINDITFALFDLGWTNEKVTDTLRVLGDEADNVNSFLEAVGLTAAEVDVILRGQKDSVEALTKSYEKLSTTKVTAPTITPEQAAAGAHMMSFSDWEIGMQAASMERQGYNEAQIASAVAEMAAGIPTYAQGGPILEDTLLLGLKSLRPYAVAHEGEKVSNGASIVITGNTFNVRQESDIDRIGEALVSRMRAMGVNP